MYYIGIDIGGMSIKGGICTQDGRILYKTSVKTNEYDEFYSISEDIAKVIDELMELSGFSINNIGGIGMGSPGSINSAAGVIRYSNNIKMTNVHVVEELEKKYGVPIYINNDANCAALGEFRFGSGKGYDNVVFITLGTGVGGGVIIEGELFEGVGGAGTELGHTVIIKDGEPCTCGRNGCWETYASATALIRITKRIMAQNPNSAMHSIAAKEGEVNGKVAFIAAKAGDKAGMQTVDEYISNISEGLINMANIFRPEIIIIGGGISYEGAFLTDKLNALMDKYSYGSAYNPKVNVITASLANDAGILGAAALAM